MAFVWGGNTGEKLTPQQVDRKRIAAALMARQAGDTSPVASPFAGINRALQGYLSGRDERRSTAAENAGLAGADAAMAGVLGAYGQSGGAMPAEYSAPGGTWTPAPPKPSLTDVPGASGDLSYGLPAMPIEGSGRLAFGAKPLTPQEMIIAGAEARGLNPIDVATAISYETGGKFDPLIKGPTTQWGQHEGLIQFGDPQGDEYGAVFDQGPEVAMQSQLDPQNGAVWKYLDKTGVVPGMGLDNIYSAINAGAPGRFNASDANNGGAAGTVAQKVAGMGDHRANAAAFLGGTWTPAEGGNTSVSTMGGQGGNDIASLLALSADPWVAQKYGGVIDALVGQQTSRDNAAYAQQLQQQDPMYQAQLQQAQLELQQAQMPQQPKPIEINGQLIDPTTMQVLGDYRTAEAAPVAPRPMNDPQERARWGIPASDTRPYAIEEGKSPQLIGGGGVTVNNDIGGGGKFEEAFAKGDADTVASVYNSGLAAQRNLGRIDQLEGLLSQSPTGMSGAATQLAGEWGINTQGLDAVQASQAIINSLVPEQRQPGSGPMSDADLALFKQSLPRIINQPGGNKTIVDTMRAIAQYDAEGASIVQRLRSGELTRPQAFEALQSRANPLSKAQGGADQAAGNAAPPPEGIDAETWAEMSPEDRALFQ